MAGQAAHCRIWLFLSDQARPPAALHSCGDGLRVLAVLRASVARSPAGAPVPGIATSTAQHRQTEMLLGTAAEDPCSGSSRRTPVRHETHLMLNSRARWTRCSRVPANAGLCT